MNGSSLSGGQSQQNMQGKVSERGGLKMGWLA